MLEMERRLSDRYCTLPSRDWLGIDEGGGLLLLLAFGPSLSVLIWEYADDVDVMMLAIEGGVVRLGVVCLNSTLTGGGGEDASRLRIDETLFVETPSEVNIETLECGECWLSVVNILVIVGLLLTLFSDGTGDWVIDWEIAELTDWSRWFAWFLYGTVESGDAETTLAAEEYIWRSVGVVDEAELLLGVLSSILEIEFFFLPRGGYRNSSSFNKDDTVWRRDDGWMGDEVAELPEWEPWRDWPDCRGWSVFATDFSLGSDFFSSDVEGPRIRLKSMNAKD